MKFDLVRPCANCPFRKDCQAGWLGQARASEISNDVLLGGMTFACHETTTFDEEAGYDAEYRPTGEEQHCAGALILIERLGTPHQMVQIADRLGLYDPDKMHPSAANLVFETADDFIAHHANERSP